MGGGSEFWSLLDPANILVHSATDGTDAKDSNDTEGESARSGVSFSCAQRFLTLDEVATELRDKKVAIDLSVWIFEGSGAVAKPYLRTLFFRCCNLMSTKFGACLPVFVSDPRIPTQDLSLKNSTRAARYRAMAHSQRDNCEQLCSSTPASSFGESGCGVPERQRIPDPDSRPPRARNWEFVQRCRECTTLLHLLGIPVIEASGESLCSSSRK